MTKITSYLDLKNFLSTLTEEQLKQPVRISETDRPTTYVVSAEPLECDYINPEGEGAEPITPYLEGGEYYGQIDPDTEKRVALQGDVYLYSDTI